MKVIAPQPHYILLFSVILMVCGCIIYTDRLTHRSLKSYHEVQVMRFSEINDSLYYETMVFKNGNLIDVRTDSVIYFGVKL